MVYFSDSCIEYNKYHKKPILIYGIPHQRQFYKYPVRKAKSAAPKPGRILVIS